MTTKSAKSRPTHRLYQVTGSGDDALWTPFAAAFPHKDGKGFNIQVPFIGRIVMREITSADTGDQGRLA